jgi:ribonuclease J
MDFTQKTNIAGRFFELKRQGHDPYVFNGKLKPYLEKNGFCMLIRSNDAFKPLLAEYAGSKGAKVHFSMWRGYLDRNKTAFNAALNSFVKPYALEYMHTSGHADVTTLKDVFKTVKPKSGIIPIHTEAPEKFGELFGRYGNIIQVRDGEGFDCG